MLEELKDVYGIDWTTTLINIMTNEQKKDWFLRLVCIQLEATRLDLIISFHKGPEWPHPCISGQHDQPTSLPGDGDQRRNALSPDKI